MLIDVSGPSTDARWIITTIIGVGVALGSQGYFHYSTLASSVASLDTRVDGLGARIDGLDTRIDRLEGRLDRMEGRLDRMDDRLRTLEIAVAQINIRLSVLERQNLMGRDDGSEGRQERPAEKRSVRAKVGEPALTWPDSRTLRIDWSAPEDGGYQVIGYEVRFGHPDTDRESWNAATLSRDWSFWTVPGLLQDQDSVCAQVLVITAEGDGIWSDVAKYEP